MSSSKTENPTTEIKSDNMTVVMSRKPGSLVSLEVTVNPTAVEAAYSKAVKSVNKDVSLPGFRKGKAPDNVIISKYGPQIKQEWRDLVIRTAFEEALELVKLQPFNNESIRCTPQGELSKGNEARFTIEFEIPPTVPHVNLENLTLKDKARPAVTKEDINGVIDNVRYYFAKWHEVTDRGVKNDDFIDLDIVKLDEPQETICQDTRFHMKEGQMANWMRKLIKGLHINESAEGTSEQEQETDEPFMPTRCKITVKAIRTAELPPLDDEFAKKVGAPDIAQLEMRVEADLNRRAEQEVWQDLHRQIDQWLIANHQFEIPASIVKDEKEARIKRAIESMQKQNVPQDRIDHFLKDNDQKVEEEAQNNYRLFFLLLSLARQHNINVTNEEIAAEISQQVMQAQNNVNLGANTGEIRSRASQMLMLRKARDFIIQQAKREKA